MNDNVEILRRYNRWRRGQALWSATADLPDPRVVGEAIDAACDEIERMRAENAELQNELTKGIHTCGLTCRKTPRCAEMADLRAELAELRSFRKVIMDYDSNLYDALADSDAAHKGEGE